MRWNPHRGVNKRKAGKRAGKRYWSHLKALKEKNRELMASLGIRVVR